MDINLPGINGIEALQQLKNNPKTNSIPVLALSAGATKEDVNKGIGVGFECYLTKPIDINQLLSAIHNALGKTRNYCLL